MLLDSTELLSMLASTLPDWQLQDGVLVKNYRLQSFASALHQLNAIAHLAEKHNHHPDLLLHGYRNLQVRLSTHSAGGITAADVQLALAIEQLKPTASASGS